MSGHRDPVRTTSDLDTLSDDEIVEGYWDGFRNERCGDNRSRDYWHGWRNGMVDGGHATIDEAQLQLAREAARRGRATGVRVVEVEK